MPVLRQLNDDLTFDHVIPRSRGGLTRWDNVVTACAPCNLAKGEQCRRNAAWIRCRQPYRPTVFELHETAACSRRTICTRAGSTISTGIPSWNRKGEGMGRIGQQSWPAPPRGRRLLAFACVSHGAPGRVARSRLRRSWPMVTTVPDGNWGGFARPALCRKRRQCTDLAVFWEGPSSEAVDTVSIIIYEVLPRPSRVADNVISAVLVHRTRGQLIIGFRYSKRFAEKEFSNCRGQDS